MMLVSTARPENAQGRSVFSRRSIITPLLTALLVAAGAAQAQQSLDWSLEPFAGNAVRLFGADSDFNNGVWVAGHSSLAESPYSFRNFIARWDGLEWVVTPVPQPAEAVDDRDHSLRSIAALGPDDAIAVGAHDKLDANVSVPQSMRWNGTDWQVLEVPDEIAGSGNGSGAFDDVARTGDTAWAVGSFVGAGPSGPDMPIARFFATRLDGDQWQAFVPPLYDGIQDQELARYFARTVAGASDDDVWIGGRVEQTGEGPDGPLLGHWNGSQWQWSDIWPLFDSGIADISDILALASDNVWAVGVETLVEGTTTRDVAVVLHWDGAQWSRVAVPDEPDRNVILHTVTARSASEIYAAGAAFPDDGPLEAYLLRYDGEDWATVPDVELADGSQFFAAAISPVGQLWLTGRANELSLPGLAQRAWLEGIILFRDSFGD
ncbi:hypothetical protein [Wenzhouxiangella sediminis]|nr:hypothetical protein [Wenzhouxiangella sediminis]